MLMTGKHSVADIYCKVCNTYIGWTYFDAFEEKEQYKIGKYVIEMGKIIKEVDTSTNRSIE